MTEHTLAFMFDPWIFACGVVGALAPELVRWYRAGAICRRSIPNSYKLISVGFFFLGGFLALVLPASTYWGAFYTGISMPILISNIAGISPKTVGGSRRSGVPPERARLQPLIVRGPPTTRVVTVRQVFIGKKAENTRKISVQVPVGSHTSLVELDVQPTDTASVIKETVCDTLKIPSNTVALMYGGMLLDDEGSVESLGLKENSSLALMPLNIIAGCIAKGTRILTESGDEKKVEDLQIDDAVTSWHLEKRHSVEGRIMHLETNRTRELIQLNDKLLVSQHQLIYCESGWKSACQIDESDKMAEVDGSGALAFVKITSVKRLNKPCLTYDMKISPFRTYFGNRILLYDTKPVPQVQQGTMTIRQWLGLITPS